MGLNYNVHGSNTYTITGSPVITNGIVNSFSTGEYLEFPLTCNLNTDSLEIGVKFTYKENTEARQVLCGIGNANNCGLDITTAGRLRVLANSNPYINNSIPGTLVDGTTYYAKIIFSNGTVYAAYSTDRQTWQELSLAGPYSYAFGAFPHYVFGNLTSGNTPFLGSVDLNETYIKVNGAAWFGVCPVEVKHIILNSNSVNYLVKDGKLVFADRGLYIEESGVKTYATKDLAPVPSGFTYGTTTTTAIGWVDMRTQQFTAAPAGATLGKDEVSEES